MEEKQGGELLDASPFELNIDKRNKRQQPEAGQNDFFGEKPKRTTVLKVKQFLRTVARLKMRASTQNSNPSITIELP